MTDLHKRSLFKLAALSAVAAAALVGCGKKEEPAPAPAPAAPAAEAPKPEPLKIGFAYVGPVGDGGYPTPMTRHARSWRPNSATRSRPLRGERARGPPTPSACCATWSPRATR